jgi:hypothetical protein
MKYIPVPEPQVVTDIEGKPVQFEHGPETITFEKFVLARLTDPKFAVNMANVLAAVSIREAVKSIRDGFLEVENEHYDLLCDLVQNPSPQAAYPAGLAHNLAPFMVAVVREARDKR